MNTEEPINDGGQAFPRAVLFDQTVIEGQGQTLRDFFAATEKLGDIDSMNDDSAILMIGSALGGPKPEGSWSDNPVEWLKWNARWRAELRYIRADAMLKAREVKP